MVEKHLVEVVGRETRGSTSVDEEQDTIIDQLKAEISELEKEVE